MDKQDIYYGVAALVVILIIALVIKPIMTGQPVNTGIPVPTTVQKNVTSDTIVPGKITQPNITKSTIAPVPTTTPIPTWNLKVTQTIGFVNPSNYGLSLNQSIPQGTRINDTTLNTSMTTIAKISLADARGGTTNTMYIPFPYWELVYTVNPSVELKPSSVEIVPTGGVGYSRSGVSGSYSTAQPQFTIQVMDGDDPNRIVRTITPPGGIDLDLWMGVKGVAKENSQVNYKKVVDDGSFKAVDPRPWIEKFYEGQRNYFFIITAQSLDSYSLEIRVPTRYIGKY
jgi:hypothetical protein